MTPFENIVSDEQKHKPKRTGTIATIVAVVIIECAVCDYSAYEHAHYAMHKVGALSIKAPVEWSEYNDLKSDLNTISTDNLMPKREDTATLGILVLDYNSRTDMGTDGASSALDLARNIMPEKHTSNSNGIYSTYDEPASSNVNIDDQTCYRYDYRSASVDVNSTKGIEYSQHTQIIALNKDLVYNIIFTYADSQDDDLMSSMNYIISHLTFR